MYENVTLIKNNEIAKRITNANKLYDLYGSVSFELKPKELEFLKKLIESYKIECRKPDFDTVTWVESHINKDGTINGGKGSLVFSFLLTHGRRARIITEMQDEMCIVTLRNGSEIMES
ncbi:hypothetical protein [Pleionea mediterranea]|uniref:Uncharacterized protein n=1 Tax=Pleionea mediterranea TaxID=523701 RepID=A0A316GGJ2_9GAMM|nr:hypothetical protein [Pleionea mediterranea]PWK53847.1 hypothetical protein C8D97_102237 [Pleionea mediterranea]